MRYTSSSNRAQQLESKAELLQAHNKSFRYWCSHLHGCPPLLSVLCAVLPTERTKPKQKWRNNSMKNVLHQLISCCRHVTPSQHACITATKLT